MHETLHKQQGHHQPKGKAVSSILGAVVVGGNALVGIEKQMTGLGRPNVQAHWHHLNAAADQEKRDIDGAFGSGQPANSLGNQVEAEAMQYDIG